MQYILILALILISGKAFAYECLGNEKGNLSSVQEHIGFASEIYLGKVISSHLLKNEHKIAFELEVSASYKGRHQKVVMLETTDDEADPNITMGHNYIIFLYDSNIVDFCGLSFDLGKGQLTQDKLESWIESGWEFNLKEKELNALKVIIQIKRKNP